MLRFSDGMEFNTSGPMHIERRSDGLYVVGGGMMVAVNTVQEGNKIIETYKAKVKK